jgi:hypothetical protein
VFRIVLWMCEKSCCLNSKKLRSLWMESMVAIYWMELYCELSFFWVCIIVDR